MIIDEIFIKDDKAIKAILDEQGVAFPVLLEVNGKVFYPDEVYDKTLRRGDVVVVRPIIAGG